MNLLAAEGRESEMAAIANALLVGGTPVVRLMTLNTIADYLAQEGRFVELRRLVAGLVGASDQLFNSLGRVIDSLCPLDFQSAVWDELPLESGPEDLSDEQVVEFMRILLERAHTLEQ